MNKPKNIPKNIPEKPTAIIQVHMTWNDKCLIRDLAQRLDTSMNQWCLRALLEAAKTTNEKDGGK
jgi:uncharacterized protein (DUF1778 family)